MEPQKRQLAGGLDLLIATPDDFSTILAENRYLSITFVPSF